MFCLQCPHLALVYWVHIYLKEVSVNDPLAAGWAGLAGGHSLVLSLVRQQHGKRKEQNYSLKYKIFLLFMPSHAFYLCDY